MTHASDRGARAELSLIGGRYAVFDVLASGGMGAVHFGRVVGSGGFSKIVAIKRLHPQFAGDAEFRAMFLEEARLASRISHPNVVSILDVVEEHGELFLVLDYVDGEALSRLLQRARIARTRVPAPVAAGIITGVLYGLHAAHEATDRRGHQLCIVHRDVSPHNVLLGSEGIARVLDFGIAKAADRIALTSAGKLKGKVAYMAPEQIAGEAVDRRADVFATGILLWELLTGERLFDADNQGAVLAKVMVGDVPPPSTRSAGLIKEADEVVARALARRPAERYPSAREFARAVEAAFPVASPSTIGDWVHGLAGEALERRAQRVREFEKLGREGERPPNRARPGGEADPSGATRTVILAESHRLDTPPSGERTPGFAHDVADGAPVSGARTARERFRSVRQYLERLPDGVRSYPDCTAKVVVLRDALEDYQVHDDTLELPEALRKLLADPPPINVWIPEVMFNAAMLAIFDEHFAQGGAERAFLAWVYQRNKRLLDRPLYRVLFRVVSPSRLLVGAHHRWNAFHRGSEVRVLERDSHGCKVSLKYPAYLFPRLSEDAFAVAVKAAAETAGAKAVTVQHIPCSPAESQYAIRWR